MALTSPLRSTYLFSTLVSARPRLRTRRFGQPPGLVYPASSLAASSEASAEPAGFAWLPDRKLRRLAIRHRTSVQTIREVLSLAHSLPTDGVITPEDDKRILPLLQGSLETPREVLSDIAKRLPEVPEFRKASPEDARVRLSLLRIAWNGGKDDGPSSAGLQLMLYRDSSNPPWKPILQTAEISSILDTLKSRGYSAVYSAEAKLAMREYESCPESDKERREALRVRVLDSLEEGAKQGHAASTEKLASLYAEGDLVERNGAKAEELWVKAAQLGDIYSAFTLGNIYHGKNRGKYGPVPLFPADRSKALKYFEMASSSETKASYFAGRYYYLDPNGPSFPSIEAHVNKWGVRPDDEKAARYFALAGATLANDPAVNVHETRHRYIPATTKLAEMLVLNRSGIPLDRRRTITEADFAATRDVDGRPFRARQMTVDDVAFFPPVLDSAGNSSNEGSSDGMERPADAKTIRRQKLQYAKDLLEGLLLTRKASLLTRIAEMMEDLNKGGSGLPRDLTPMANENREVSNRKDGGSPSIEATGE